jgi:serine protease Do
MKTQNIIVIAVVFLAGLISCNAENQSEQIITEQSAADTELIAKVYYEASRGESEQDKKLENLNNCITNSRQNALTDAIKEVSPAIVGINVTEVRTVQYRNPYAGDPLFERFFGRRGGRTAKQEVHGLGSGFIISPDGYILTNHHVAGDASKIIISMTDGEKYPAEIIGADKTSDVALLKIDAKNLPYLPLSNSDEVIIGEWAIAFGNPFGLFDNNAKPTVTVGVVSNVGVSFMQDGRVYPQMIQTDAAISSGNSGGPLVNARGEVIGMNTIIFTTSQGSQGAGSIGIGFSIPINRVKKIVDLLKDKKTIDRNYYVGMEVRDIDEEIAKYIDTDLTRGAVVFSIARQSPAEKAGFEPGDIVLSINAKPVLRRDDYLIEMNDGIVGQIKQFKILRGETQININLKLNPVRKKVGRARR